jgi:hypothetical protein
VTTLQKTLLVIAVLLIPFAYYFYTIQKPNEVIHIKPIVVEPQVQNDTDKELASNDEIFHKLEKAIETSKRAVNEEEIAKNVLLALEKNVHKPLPILKNESTEPKIEHNVELHSTSVEQKEEKIVTKVEVKQKTIETQEKERTKEVIITKTEANEVAKTPKIVFVSQKSHSEITQRSTLIENTHPEAKLTLYNGSKAYVLDESAETEEIGIDEEEFANLPWSKTYGVVEESEHFEIKEEI